MLHMRFERLCPRARHAGFCASGHNIHAAALAFPKEFPADRVAAVAIARKMELWKPNATWRKRLALCLFGAARLTGYTKATPAEIFELKRLLETLRPHITRRQNETEKSARPMEKAGRFFCNRAINCG